jgi:hypothetical protein
MVVERKQAEALWFGLQRMLDTAMQSTRRSREVT